MEIDRRKKVLIIDDEELICWSLKKVLEKDDKYSVSCAYNGSDALRNINDNQFDVVITDIRFPDVKDYDILKQIKDISVTTPVIIISAYLSDPDLDDIVRKSGFRCINKPFEIEDVLGEVHAAVKFNRIQGNS